MVYDLAIQTLTFEILNLTQKTSQKSKPHQILNMLVGKIAEFLKTDVCSLYLLDSQENILVLRATFGLAENAIGQVRLKLNEGLVGKTFSLKKPISMADSGKDPDNKLFKKLGEENFRAFLAVPLIHNRKALGVLVVQNKKPKKFSKATVQNLVTLSLPAVLLIEKNKLVDAFSTISNKEKQTKVNAKMDHGISHAGVAASGGIAIGKAYWLTSKNQNLKPNLIKKLPQPIEKTRLIEAFRWVEEEVLSLTKKAQKTLGIEEVAIFDAYRMVLESQPLKEEMFEEIEKGHSAYQALEMVLERYSSELEIADDPYLSERVYDIRDLKRRLTDFLMYGERASHQAFVIDQKSKQKRLILVANYLSITDFIQLDSKQIKGILCAQGGASSHLAILAQSLAIPCVLGVGSFIDKIKPGDFLVLDGRAGIVMLNPPKKALKHYQNEQLSAQLSLQKTISQAHKKAKTKDKVRVVVGANLGLVSHIKQAERWGAEEIGLYRTELPFLLRRSLPSEDEQYLLYAKVLKAFKNKPVTIRTLDLGGDKDLAYLNLPKENNPFLGWRSIRIFLDRQDLFRIQLRALLRASQFGRLRILFPLICSLQEIRKVKEIYQDVCMELKREKVLLKRKVELGMMMEVPAAVLMAKEFAKEVDFFSIGTNDLTQYTLAVDRNNAHVANLFDSLHPAVLRLIDHLVKVCEKQKIDLSVCGEMAANPMGLFTLLGLGIKHFSMNGPMIASMKKLIAAINLKSAVRISRKVIRLDEASQVRKTLREHFINQKLTQFLE